MTERCSPPLAVIAMTHVPSAAMCRSFSSRFHSRPPPSVTSFVWCPRPAQNRTSHVDVLCYCGRRHALNTLFAYVTVERAWDAGRRRSSDGHERISHHMRCLTPMAIFREQLLERRIQERLIMSLNGARRTRTAIRCLTATINRAEDLYEHWPNETPV